MSLLSWKFFSIGYGLMGVLFFIAIVGLIFSIERLLFFKQYNIDVAIFIDGIRNLVSKNRITEAIDLCEKDGSPAANIIRTALMHNTLTPEELKAHVKSMAILEIPRCEQRISPLRTISKISPALGLMGVVLSYYTAFDTLQTNGLTYTSSDIFSQEISSAMLLIIFSLAISVFSNLAYNFLYGIVQSIIYKLEWTYNEALRIVLFEKK